MTRKRTTRQVHPLLHHAAVLVSAALFTLGLFLVLPVMQSIAKQPPPDTRLQGANVADVPPPPPPPEEEPPEEEPEEEPPQFEEAPPLDLSQLEVALNPGGAGLWSGDAFAPKINTRELMGGVDDILASMGDLDSRPRVVYQPGPMLDAKLRKLAPATVYVIFIVDTNGRVENAQVQNPLHPSLNKAALNAVKQWKFEPGMKSGEPVRFRMRVPITFPEG
ncbi:energy transducer TonB [Mucisphaera calidilacus]|uniref:Gram-negative bacterial tonB protein n=1 Tax=Mucisphaera calidilacus TaxID=2527982 RepID=A0A518BUC9_9BACT|nr:energy transducer TonB [Mucisphaera calidilacus]QDU70603.1 Gram-negative bacterial tonB protein [Mucisphaera calidilacus]